MAKTRADTAIQATGFPIFLNRLSNSIGANWPSNVSKIGATMTVVVKIIGIEKSSIVLLLIDPGKKELAMRVVTQLYNNEKANNAIKINVL